MQLRYWFLSAAVLLAGTVSVASADYMVVRIVVNKPTGTMPIEGQGLLGGGPGPMGGALGIGGANPIGPGTGAGGNLGNGGGFPRPMPPMPPMGASGGINGGINGGIMGGNPMGMNGMTGTTPPPPPTASLNPDDFVIAVIELKETWSHDKKNFWIRHKWSAVPKVHSLIYRDNTEVLVTPKSLKTPAQIYAVRNRTTTGLARTPEWLHDTASFCVSVGLIDESRKILDELVRNVEALVKAGKAPPKHITDTVAAWKKLSEELNLGTEKNEFGKSWKEKLGYRGSKTSEHYCLIYDADSNSESLTDSINRRLAYLEQNFRTFYIWHAIHGKIVPLPTQKLVGVITKDARDFIEQKEAFDGPQNLATDGFFAKRDNLMIFSPQRLDPAYENFRQLSRPIFEKYNFTALLKTNPIEKQTYAKRNDPVIRDEIARGQMFAMVEQALIEEAENASATHEGTLQLYAALGQIPRNVIVPEWLKFGLASQFDLPKAPFPGSSSVKVAFWGGAGGPSWAWMKYYEDLVAQKRIGDPADALRGTITDSFFRMAAEGKEPPHPVTAPPKTPAEPPVDPNDPLVIKTKFIQAQARAKTLSWGLTWYLLRTKPDQLQKFSSELKMLPRDLELDEAALELMFARAFSLTKGTGGSETVDPVAMKTFATEWLRWLSSQHSQAIDLKLEDPAIESFTPGTDPMGGGGPGPIGKDK